MECTTLELLPESKHRYKVLADLYNRLNAKYFEVTLFLDLGCYNTLIPRNFAEISGTSLGFNRRYKIDGDVIEAEAFSID